MSNTNIILLVRDVILSKAVLTEEVYM